MSDLVDPSVDAARPLRCPRIPREVRGSTQLLGTFGHWHVAVMDLDAVPGPIVEVARLRAAKHHDCHT